MIIGFIWRPEMDSGVITPTTGLSGYITREIERATVVPDRTPLAGIVGMESEVTFRDDATGLQKQVTLVYPKSADIEAGRISVLTAIGAALIGLAVGQAISFETPSGELRSLTVLEVHGPN